jgi:hypothetical protein
MSSLYEQLEEELTVLKSEYTALTIEIPRDETYAQQLERHLLNGRIAGIKYVLGIMENTQNGKKTYAEGYTDGAQYAIEYLGDLFDGVEDTDIYADYFTEEN